MQCPTCQEVLPEDTHFCPGCGSGISPIATGATRRLSPVTIRSCPKCSNIMEHGFIPDEYRDRNEVTVWVQGEPQRQDVTGEVILVGANMWRVATYRCIGCGYLESYAIDQLKIG